MELDELRMIPSGFSRWSFKFDLMALQSFSRYRWYLKALHPTRFREYSLNHLRTDMKTLPDELTIRTTLRPGDVGYVTYLHGTLYAAECGWDHTFEAYVAGPLAEFAKSQKHRERIWIIEKGPEIVGSIAIVEASDDEAQLRWFLLQPSLRGQGIGRFLMDEVMRFCREKEYRRIILLTEKSLLAAAKLYEDYGFVLTEQKTHELWGSIITDQKYELNLQE
jgi:ribosomal protein S18 acetylase RimI-like enzyme